MIKRVRRIELFPRQAAFCDAFAGVKHDDVLREMLCESGRIRRGVAFCVRHDAAIVFRRHSQERTNVLVTTMELARNRVEERGLPCSVLVFDVVKENGEVADAELVEAFQFRKHGRTVCCRVLAIKMQAEAGRDGEDEADAVCFCCRDEFREVVELFFRIRFAPTLAMIEIVLRRIDVGIEAMLFAERDYVETFRLRPRRAVKALDDAAHRHGRSDSRTRKSAPREHAEERHHH